MYHIIGQECSVYGETGEPLHKVVILVDTEADIPEPQTDWMTGSYCMIVKTHTYKILSNERTWI